MGPAKRGGQVPGGDGRSIPDKPGDPTQVVDHRGEAATSIKNYIVDKGAINSYLDVGRSTGPWWPGLNDCNTWVAKAIRNSIPHDIYATPANPDPLFPPVVLHRNVVVYADGSIHQPGEVK